MAALVGYGVVAMAALGYDGPSPWVPHQPISLLLPTTASVTPLDIIHK